MNWGSRNIVKMGNNVMPSAGKITYIGDCPNPGDFELVQKNLIACLDMQRDYWAWKKKQEGELQ